MKQKGFTLIELLVVISIIGLLSSIVMASINSARDRAVIASAMRFSFSLHNAIGSDLVGWWNLEEGPSGGTVNDLSGFNRHGDAVNVSWSTDTFHNNSLWSLDLDGLNGYVRISNDDMPSSVFQEGFSISAWIKPRSLGGSQASGGFYYGRIVDKAGGVNPTNGFRFSMVDGNRLSFQANQSGSGAQTPANSISMDKWTHVLVTLSEDGSVSFYINGIERNSTGPSSARAAQNIITASNLGIGANVNNPNSTTFDGLIDDVRIYTKALTTFDAHSIYALSANKYISLND